MPRFEYQFDTRIDDSSRRFKRRLRLVVLFLFISAVTAGLIWLIIPKESKPESADSGVVSETAVEGEKVKNSAGKIASEKENASSVPSGAATDAENVSGEAESTAVPVEGEPVVAEPDLPTEIPEKGKVWVNDPPADIPEKAVNKTEISKIDVLKDLSARHEYSALAAGALDIMQSENEGSTNYRIAAKYLLEARIGQLASNTGVPGISYRYTVRGGDTLSRIARRNKTTVAGLMHYNRLTNGFIRTGRKFIVHKGAWSISVSKSKRLLKLFHSSETVKPFAVFEVGVGRLNSTPAGGFVISSRIKDPEWRAPDGRIFEHGDPGNELGNYFLKLAATGTPDRPFVGYGIHGTPDESTVGKSLSSGCIRMRNADVELLYNLVPERTPVNITE